MRTADLDEWLPKPAIRSRHRRTGNADPDAIWEAAMGVRLNETRTVGRLVQWRLPETPQDLTFRDLLARDPFTVLAEGDRWSLSGMCGQIWTLRRDYPHLDGAEDFRAWDKSGTVRVLFAHWVEEEADGRHTLISESRIEPVNRRARIPLRALWTAISRFERLIGAEPVALAIRRAEEASRTAGTRA